MFYVGSLAGGGILKVRRGGAAVPFVAGREGLQVIGLRVDPAGRRLWGATLEVDSAAPPFQRGVGGRSARHAWSLDSGERLGTWAAPDPRRPQLLNDIALTPAGDVFVTDSEGEALHRLRAGGAALETVATGEVRLTYPNGVAVSGDGERLYVAHAAGLLVGDARAPDAGGLVPVPAPAGVPTSGIDGLYVCGGDLVAVQSLLDLQ